MRGLQRILCRSMVALGLAAGLAGQAGCATQPRLGQWAGPKAAVGTSVQDWPYQGERAKVIYSTHYRIHTTLQDDDMIELLPQLMEGALAIYRDVAPDVPLTDKPMDCYVFRWRSEWNAFTQRNTGQDARIYLQIRSGGYTVRDLYVAYYIGRIGTFSVAAHEGWHQYLGRHFKGRLPPFIEEGFACMFEGVSWNKRLPRWNLAVNPYRAESLKKALDNRKTLPLEKLVTMHAGDIVGGNSDEIDAFYAQSWAFARFLWDFDGGKHRPGVRKLMNETALGTVRDPTGSHTRANYPWNRRGVRPMLEYYLGQDLGTLEEPFRLYMRRIAYEELALHWKQE